jgi:3-phosphoshikimate 1-carboxyvinyltransferase
MKATMDFLDLPPLLGAQGTVRLPGSKSISNRVLLLSALAKGETLLCDLLHSDDVERMLEALKALGVMWEKEEGGPHYRVQGIGGGGEGGFPVKSVALFLGNAGTAFRPLTAALAFSDGEYLLSGVHRMHERPIRDLVDALRVLGADITYLQNDGYPPLQIRPATVRAGGVVPIRGDVSSQFLTALLMALPLTGEETRIEVQGELISKPYIRITLELMARFGVTVKQEGWQAFVVPGGVSYQSPGTVFVEGDASSASYFLAAGTIGGGPVRVEGVGKDSIQGDVHFAKALETLGAEIRMGENWIEARAPENGRLRAFDMDLNHIPDAAMTLAVAALFADGPCTLRNIASWRVKETDRIAAMACELRKMGAEVDEFPDALRITPPDVLRPPCEGIDTYDDHRMAMCFSLAAFGPHRVRIHDPACVNKTFPDYFKAFSAIVRPVPVIAMDGPGASGKGSVAQALARRLGWHCLDSGSLYRITAFLALDRGIALEDEAAVAALAQHLPARFESGHVFVDQHDITEAIRTEAVSVAASKVASLGEVRKALLARQRDYRQAPGLVAEGRDMGSAVFADADLKIFLTACVDVRAQRRHKQLIEKGMPANIADLLKDLEERDARDRARTHAPLEQQPDATLLDTSDLTLDQSVDFIEGLWKETCDGANRFRP